MVIGIGSRHLPIAAFIAASLFLTTACGEVPTAPSATAAASATSLGAVSNRGSVSKASTTARICTVADAPQIQRSFEVGRLTVTNGADCTLYAGFGAYYIPNIHDPDLLQELWLAQTSSEIAPHSSGVLTVGWTEHCGDWVQEDFWILPRLVTSNPPRDENGVVRSGPETLLPGRNEPREIDGKRFLTTAGDCVVRPPSPPVTPPTPPTPPVPPVCSGSSTLRFPQGSYIATFPVGYPDPWYPSQLGPFSFSIPAGSWSFTSTTGDEHIEHAGEYPPGQDPQQHESVKYEFYAGAELLATSGATTDIPTDVDVMFTNLGVLTFAKPVTAIRVIHAGPISEFPNDSLYPVTLTYSCPQ
ncbi:MAG: hypothetical protein ABJA98_15860 [Acidobacteriota bacterium]